MAKSSDHFGRLQLYTVLNSLPDGVTLADADGRIVFSNAAADRILGTAAATDATPDEWAERYGVFQSDGATPFPTDEYPLVRALSGEHTRDTEMVIRNASIPDGAIISVSGRPLEDEAGATIGACVVFRDITELRRVERLKDELTAFIVHDLKNPLAVIATTCELLDRAEPRDPKTAEEVTVIREAALRMNRMVMDLLDMQMAEDGMLELELGSVDVPDLLDRVARAGGPRLRERGQRIEVARGRPVSVLADEAYLFRVLINLVDNCAKYGPENGVVRLGAAQGDRGTVTLSISDEGPGVPSHLHERIFEKYAQVERDADSRSAVSRGLGLRFCKVVIDAHEGRIWVEDVEPRGAKFCVELHVAGESA